MQHRFSERFTAASMHERARTLHRLHQVNQAAWNRPRLHAYRPPGARQCATTREAVKLLRSIPPDRASTIRSRTQPARRRSLKRRRRRWPCMKESTRVQQSFRAPALLAYNRRNPGSTGIFRHWKSSPPAAAGRTIVRSAQQLPVAVFDHRYSGGSGTLHTVVCTPAARRMLVGVGGDAAPQSIEFGNWLRGVASTYGRWKVNWAAPRTFDPSRRVVTKPAMAASPTSSSHALNGAVFKDLSWRTRTLPMSACARQVRRHRFQQHRDNEQLHFKGMQIAGRVSDLFAAYKKHRPFDRG